MRQITEPTETLHGSEPRFRDLLEVFPAAVYATDASGRLTFFNRAAEQLAGRTPVVGRDMWCVSWRLYEADGTPLPPEQCPMAVAIRTGEPVRGVEVIAERPDGERVPLMPFPTPLRDAHGRVTGGVNMLVDMRALKRAEAAAARRADEQAALYRFTDRLYRAESLEQAYEAAIDAILSALRCSRASILVFDESGAMRFVASRGLSQRYRDRVVGHTPWRRGEPQPAPICIDDVAKADLPADLQTAVAEEGIAALAFIPLATDGGVAGKFMAYYDAPHAFGPEQIDLALTIARQLGFALERARAAHSLKLSEERYRAVVEGQAEMLCRFSRDGTISFVNQAYARSRDTTVEALTGGNFWDFVYADDRPFVQAMLDRLTPERPEVRIENRFETRDGPHWTLWTNRALSFDGNGRWLEAQSSGIDITDRKRAEEALRESEERFRAIVDTTPECVKLVARDGTLLHMNASGLAFVGAGSADQVQGKCIYDVIAPEDRDRFREMNESVCDGEKRVLKFDVIGLDGERRHMETHATPFRFSDGAMVQLAVTRDITEQRRAEERQRRRDAEFRALADNIHHLAWMAHARGEIYWVNQRWLDYTGVGVEQLKQDGARMVHHPDFIEQVAAKFWSCVEAGVPWEDTFPLRGKDGEYRWFLSRALPIRDENGAVVRWFGTNTDITDRRVAEEQRTLLINELNHRVKNTLATVQSLAMHTLRSTERSADAAELFESRLAALSRAHDLLNAESWQGASLREVVDRSMAPFRLAERVRIAGPDVRLTPRQALSLSIALHELATNAAKYGALSGRDGGVEISWSVGPMLALNWTESGGPPVERPTRTGFGTRLIERSLSNDLGGEAKILFRPEGVVAYISTPIEARATESQAQA